MDKGMVIVGASKDDTYSEDPQDVSGEEFDLTKPPSSFTPELQTESTKVTYRFRCPGPGVFQCALTGLVFVVDQEAELLYKTVQWDEKLLQLSSSKMAAGPLFDIQCPEGGVSELHLPHSVSKEALQPDLLSVVHVDSDGMYMMNPLKVTDSHVIVKLTHLSIFGLIYNIIMRSFTTTGRVMLFLRPPNTLPRILTVILLQDNVPLPEVESQQRGAEFINISGECQLSYGQSYSVHSDHEEVQSQPPSYVFHPKFGPNYLPTFDVFLPLNCGKVTLSLQDKEMREVWKRDVPLPGQLQSRTAQRNLEQSNVSVEKIRECRHKLIKGMSSAGLDSILDKLYDHGVVSDAEMEKFSGNRRRDKAQMVVDMVLRKGKVACSLLIEFVRAEDPHLCRDISL